MVRVGVRCITAGVAALVIGFALKGGLFAGSADAGSQAEQFDVFSRADVFPPREAFASRIDTQLFDRQPLGGAPVALRPGVRLASLEMDIPLSAARDEALPEAAPLQLRGASFEERFSATVRRAVASFDDRFSPRLQAPKVSAPVVGILPSPRLYTAGPSVADASKADPARRGPVQQDIAAAAGTPAPKVRLASLEAPDNPLSTSDADAHTAIYDISARAVYLPDGSKLEAHSGLGSHIDDVRSATLKMQGVTPPGVYKLTIREALFHGVRAIRLNPVEETKMYGRAGMLAHPFMLGPNGQSNGCVSFKDYPAFLAAFQRGEFDRLVVVERLANPPGGKGGSGWIAQALHKLFKAPDEPAVASSGDTGGQSGGRYASAFQ